MAAEEAAKQAEAELKAKIEAEFEAELQAEIEAEKKKAPNLNFCPIIQWANSLGEGAGLEVEASQIEGPLEDFLVICLS